MVGIVLGAGASRRLGRPKQTLSVGDTTLLGYVLREAEASTLDRIVLVVGGAADEALAGFEPRRATVARNDSYGSGCASSLLAGLDAAGETDAVMLLLGDMPGVGAPLIDESPAPGPSERPWAAVTSYRGERGTRSSSPRRLRRPARAPRRQGGLEADRVAPRAGGACRCRP